MFHNKEWLYYKEFHKTQALFALASKAYKIQLVLLLVLGNVSLLQSCHVCKVVMFEKST